MMNKFDQILFKDGTSVFGEVKKETDSSIEFRNATRMSLNRSTKRTYASLSSRSSNIGWHRFQSKRVSGSVTYLGNRGIQHQVLNAKHHEREAEIVAQAGKIWRSNNSNEYGWSWYRHYFGRLILKPKRGRCYSTSTQLDWKSQRKNGISWFTRSKKKRT